MTAMGSLAALAFLALGVQDAEERIKDAEYDDVYVPLVRACETSEKEMQDDPAGALRRLEEEVLPRLPEFFEVRIAVIYTRGINRGEVRERRDFYPYRLAGKCALEAGLSEKAVEYLKKSPSSGALLERAEQALADKRKRGAPPPPPPALQKPRLDLSPFLERHDYAGALRELETHRERLGDDFERQAGQVRRAAADHASRQVAAFAAALPRILEEGFFQDHLKPCLEACRHVPEEVETPELRWARDLGEWFKDRDAAEFERLALRAAKFDEKFHAVCRLAQEDRIREMEGIVEEILQAPRAGRPALLARLDAAERAFQDLVRAREARDLAAALAALKARLPIDAEALERARAGAASIGEIRVMADELGRLWASERRARLSVQDRRDLALHLGLCRSMALFLDGRRIEEVAADLRIMEAFRAAGPLPPGVSPKVARVYALAREPR